MKEKEKGTTFISKISWYFWNLLISLDQLANTILGGYPDETISSRCAKKRDTNKFCYYFCNFLDWIDPNHSDESIELDEGEK